MKEQVKYSPSKEQMIEMFRKMCRIRYFEYKVAQFCQEKVYRGPLHLYVGVVGSAVGACAALEKGAGRRCKEDACGDRRQVYGLL